MAVVVFAEPAMAVGRDAEEPASVAAFRKRVAQTQRERTVREANQSKEISFQNTMETPPAAPIATEQQENIEMDMELEHGVRVLEGVSC